MKSITPTILLPETGFVRLPNIIGDSKSQPPKQAIIPVSRRTWWAGVKSGRYLWIGTVKSTVNLTVCQRSPMDNSGQKKPANCYQLRANEQL